MAFIGQQSGRGAHNMSVDLAVRKTEAETSSVVTEYLSQRQETEVQRRARLANMLIACQNLMAKTE